MGLKLQDAEVRPRVLRSNFESLIEVGTFEDVEPGDLNVWGAKTRCACKSGVSGAQGECAYRTLVAIA
jgi:hypothetical protein